MSFKQNSPIPILEGGSNTRSFSHVFGVAYYDGAALNNIDPGTSGFVLTSNGNGGAASFQAVSASGSITTVNGNTGSVTPTAGAITISGSGPLSSSGSGSTLALTTSAANVIHASSGDATASSNAFTIVGASGITTSATGSTVTITGSGVTQGIVTINGSTGSITGTTVSIEGTDSNIVTAGSGTAFTIQLIDSPVLAGTLTVDTGLVLPSFITYGAVVTDDAGDISVASANTLGYVLTDQGVGNPPIFAPATGGGGFAWNNNTAGTQAMVAGNGYVDNGSGSPTVYTLPATAAIGDIVAIQGASGTLWQVQYGAGQFIAVNGSTSTITSGSVSSNGPFDSAVFMCIATDNGWTINGGYPNLTFA